MIPGGGIGVATAPDGPAAGPPPMVADVVGAELIGAADGGGEEGPIPSIGARAANAPMTPAMEPTIVQKRPLRRSGLPSSVSADDGLGAVILEDVNFKSNVAVGGALCVLLAVVLDLLVLGLERALTPWSRAAAT